MFKSANKAKFATKKQFNKPFSPKGKLPYGSKSHETKPIQKKAFYGKKK